MTLKYSEVAGYDPEAVAAANRAYDARTGFRLSVPAEGCPRLEYPPYVPAVPGYRLPEGALEVAEMSAAIFEWNERWAQGMVGWSIS